MPTARRSRGERAGITREAILAAALRLVDRDGLSSLSMRRLGAELDVEAMTLYHHVSNKEALLDGLVEHLLAQVSPPSNGGRWRTDLEDYARSLRDLLLRHPQVLSLVLTRPAMTPHNLRAMENTVSTLHEAGFALPRALDVVYSIVGFVVAHCAAQANAAEHGQRETRLAAMDPAEYPLLTAAARETEGTESARFDFVITAMLDGFNTTLAR